MASATDLHSNSHPIGLGQAFTLSPVRSSSAVTTSDLILLDGRIFAGSGLVLALRSLGQEPPVTMFGYRVHNHHGYTSLGTNRTSALGQLHRRCAPPVFEVF